MYGARVGRNTVCLCCVFYFFFGGGKQLKMGSGGWAVSGDVILPSGWRSTTLYSARLV